MRVMFEAAGEYFNTYGKLHNASNEQKKDGSLKQFGDNARKAHNAALKHLKKNSKSWKNLPVSKAPKASKALKKMKLPKSLRSGLLR